MIRSNRVSSSDMPKPYRRPTRANETTATLAGVRGLPRLGSGGLTPRRHNEREAASVRSEATEDAAGAVDPGGRSTAAAAAAGPRGEVPGGVRVFPVARRNS